MVNVGLICLVASSCWLETRRRILREKRKGWDSRRSASNEKAHRPPAESEALYGNQQRCHKQFRSFIQF